MLRVNDINLCLVLRQSDPNLFPRCHYTYTGLYWPINVGC